LSVTILCHEKEAYHYKPLFLWKMDKFIYYINQDVCIKEILLNDQPLLDSDEGNSTSSATPRFELGHKRKKKCGCFA